jgi:hypothetical protein
MRLSVLSTEHRSAWKQPSTRYANLSLQNTAITSTSQAGTQPRFSGTQTQPNTASSLTLISSTQDKTYNAKDTSHGLNMNMQDISLALQHNTASDITPSSVLSTKHCSEWKQPYTRHVNLSSPKRCNTIYQPSEDAAEHCKLLKATTVHNRLSPQATKRDHYRLYYKSIYF